MRETATYIRPEGLDGVEALQADFVRHAYRPHSHPTWTVATMERGAARFALDDTEQLAADGELFVLEPEAVHTCSRPARTRTTEPPRPLWRATTSTGRPRIPGPTSRGGRGGPRAEAASLSQGSAIGAVTARLRCVQASD